MFGCPCDIRHAPIGGQRASYYSEVSGITKVQECTDYLEDTFEDYNIDLGTLDDIIEYLDYFGEIEDWYECSGICNYQSVYYFSDTLNGAPEEACWESIKDDILLGEIFPMGVAYFVSGLILFCILFVQYGL